MITLTELFSKLKREDEVILIDKLGITSDEIVNQFEDKIEEQFDTLVEDYEEEIDE